MTLYFTTFNDWAVHHIIQQHSMSSVLPLHCGDPVAEEGCRVLYRENTFE